MKALFEAQKPLGKYLIERGLIKQEDLDNALSLQKERPSKLGRILTDLGYVAEREVLSALGEQLRVQ